VAGSVADFRRNAPQKVARSPRRVASPARRLWPSRLRANLFFRGFFYEPEAGHAFYHPRSRENRLKFAYGAPTRLRDRLPSRAGREGCPAPKSNAATLTRRSGYPSRESFAPRRDLRRQKLARWPSPEQKGAKANRLFSNRHFRPKKISTNRDGMGKKFSGKAPSAESHLFLTIR
jgi:hypothetical protein